jgi:hypothetical protein
VLQASDPHWASVVNVRDSMGRVVEYSEYSAQNVLAFHRYGLGQTNGQIAYDADSHVLHDTTGTRQSVGTTLTVDTNYYYTGTDHNGHTGYQGGGVTVSTATATGSSQYTATTTNTYIWANTTAPLMYSISYNYQSTGHNFINGTTYNYDSAWNLDWVKINDGDPRQVQYAYNAQGQIMSRTVYVQNSPSVVQQEYYEYLNGVQLGDTGNNGPSQTDYATAITQRPINPLSTSPWANSNAANNYAGGPQSFANFDSNYQPITASDPGSAPAGYTVQDGDTLQTIAARLWGDGSMWWLIADANGLTGTETLQAGQTLQIPNKVTNVHHNTSTFEVYDPSQKLGDLQPGVLPTPAPPKHGGCGIIGKILTAIVAIVVTWATFGALSGVLGPVLGGAIAGAAGSIASQGFAILTGNQDHFSWKAVGMAALEAALFGPQPLPDKITVASIAQAALVGATRNAITQGIGVAIGLQDRFDWTGVAVGAAVGAVSGIANVALSGVHLPPIAKASLRGTASALAGAATRSLITGTDFRDNLLTDLPSIIGNTIGNVIAADRAGVDQQSHHGIHGPFDLLTAVLNAPVALLSTATKDIALGVKDVVSSQPSANFTDITTYRELASVGASPETTLPRSGAHWLLGPDGAYVPADPADEVLVNARRSFFGDLIHGRWNYLLPDLKQDLNSFEDSIFSSNFVQSSLRVASVVGAGATNFVNQKIEQVHQDIRVVAAFNPGPLAVQIVSDFAKSHGTPGAAHFLSHQANVSANMQAGAATSAFDFPVGVPNGLAFTVYNLNPVGVVNAGIEAFGGQVDSRAPNSNKFWDAAASRFFDGSAWASYKSDAIGLRSSDPHVVANSSFDFGYQGTSDALEGLSFAGGFELGRGPRLGGGCFVAGTPVHTRDGVRPIDKIRIGDFVLSQPQFTGDAGFRRVVDTFVVGERPVFEVSFRDTSGLAATVRATPQHPFWVNGIGWTAVQNLDVSFQ